MRAPEVGLGSPSRQLPVVAGLGSPSRQFPVHLVTSRVRSLVDCSMRKKKSPQRRQVRHSARTPGAAGGSQRHAQAGRSAGCPIWQSAGHCGARPRDTRGCGRSGLYLNRSPSSFRSALTRQTRQLQQEDPVEAGSHSGVPGAAGSAELAAPGAADCVQGLPLAARSIQEALQQAPHQAFP